MRRALIGGLVLGFVLSLGLPALADDDEGGALPWQKGGEKPAGETAKKAGVDLKNKMSTYEYNRHIKPILAQIEVAEKQMELYNKEMEKEERRQSLAKALGYQEKAAKVYTGASLRAKQAAKAVDEAELKDAITSQFEKPCMAKAIALYLEIADTRLRNRDVRGAVARYQQVLKLDPENEDAKAGLKKIQEAIAQAREQQGGGQVVGGGGDDDDDAIKGTEDSNWKKNDAVRDATGGRGF